ncbi:MAG: RNA-binding protein [Bacteroidales bacterium]|nr:RNA-binding protein [Bacteroidales bacterium]
MNIFVAKLSSGTTGEDLKQLFETFGVVELAKVIIDRDTNQSKGYGSVEMPDEQEALEAINNLNDSELKGNRIVVKVSEPKPQSQFRPRPRFTRDDR